MATREDRRLLEAGGLFSLMLVLASCAGAPQSMRAAPEAPTTARMVEPAESPASELTDADIAHIAVTANAIDIDLARLARERGSSADVRAFADRMITDHTAVNRQAADLAARLGVTPTNNPMSRSLAAGAEAARAELISLSGAAFDRAYMAREVGYHKAVLDALDGVLIPGTANAELRALLQQVRPAIAAHLDHARRLQAGLGG